ncbi:SAM-dependent methyltransferase [Plantactinospora sp. WMMB782]|uniref:SAM-dependent methyltransferase n=1 Tax=Plantactinospora sp. WMMB782 TaxID=3404121 RepID=UPI003B947BB8
MPSVVRPHLPQRPIWLCRACARPWPCPVARSRLAVEYSADPVALHVYLATVLQDAVDDLYRLNPEPGPDPAAMYARFLAWAAPRLRLAGSYSPVMAGSAVPERLRWAVDLLKVAPGDHLLEIGCGNGIAVSLVCDRLVGGRIVAIDRSPAAIRQAERRNREHTAAGRAVFRLGSLEESDLDGECFDKIFAVDVNLFWTRSPGTELALLRRLLRPTGGLYLCYQPPQATRVAELVQRLPATLSAHGFPTTAVTSATTRTGSLLCVSGRPG